MRVVSSDPANDESRRPTTLFSSPSLSPCDISYIRRNRSSSSSRLEKRKTVTNWPFGGARGTSRTRFAVFSESELENGPASSNFRQTRVS